MKYFYSVLILLCVAIILTFSIGSFYAYFYPMKYSSVIRENSEKYELEPALIASVINVESSFKSERVSNKGATGLMQLMPSTAEWICGKLGEEYSEEKLQNPEYNIRLGSYYLAQLMRQFENQKCALCAYNAGPTNVRNWLSDKALSKDGKTLDDIPFTETKDYINKVEKNLSYYKRKYR